MTRATETCIMRRQTGVAQGSDEGKGAGDARRDGSGTGSEEPDETSARGRSMSDPLRAQLGRSWIPQAAAKVTGSGIEAAPTGRPTRHDSAEGRERTRCPQSAGLRDPRIQLT